MIHLFIISNSINTAVAHAIIKREAIARKNVVFICLANQPKDKQYLSYDLTELYHATDFNRFKGVKRLFDFIFSMITVNRIDRVIRNIVDGDFHFYAMHLGTRFNQIISTHKSCKGVSFVEDGLYAYRDYSDLTFNKPKNGLKGKVINGLRGFMCLGSRVFFNMHNAPNFKDIPLAYGVSKQSFSLFPVKPIDISSNLEGLITSNIFEQSESFLIFDSIVQKSNCYATSERACTEFYKKIIKILEGSGQKSCFYKFHPGQLDRQQNDLRLLLEQSKVEFRELERNFSLEAELHSDVKHTFYGLHSSLLFYAGVYGHTVNSYMQQFIEEDIGYRDFVVRTSYPKEVFYSVVTQQRV